MKFVVIGPKKYHYTKSIAEAINKYGYDTSVIYYNDFYETCTYFQRKIYKFGFSYIKEQWNNNWEESLIKSCKEISDYSKEQLCILITSNIDLSNKILSQLKQYKMIIWLWDSVKNNRNEFIKKLKFYNRVYAFEKKDVPYLKQAGINAEYLPWGYSEKFFYNMSVNEDIDISFIGMPDDDRLKTAECLAQYASEHNLNFRIYGEWYDKRHFWRKYKYSKQHPYLYECIENRMVSAAESAKIYNRSKLCMNINRKIHTSINPRTFEIMATNTCMFMNTGVDINGVLVPNIDYVEYKDDDLLYKVDYMLKNEKARKNIANSGLSKIKKKYSIENLCKHILHDVNDI